MTNVFEAPKKRGVRVGLSVGLFIVAGVVFCAFLFPISGKPIVTVFVEEPAGITRMAEPVTSGIPLPKGKVKNTKKLSLVDADGQPVACGFMPLCRWPDDSIKWTLLDFQTDILANSATKYTLCIGGKSPAPSKRVSIRETASGITIKTGRLTALVSTNAAGLIQSISLDGKEIVSPDNPVQAILVRGNEKVFKVSRPTDTVIESNGPMRATVLLRGEFVTDDGEKIHSGKVGYDLRLTAYAGKPYLKLAFTLKNEGFYGYRNEGRPRQWLYFKSLRIDVPVVGTGRDDWVARLSGKECAISADQPVSLMQWYKYPRVNARGYLELRVEDETERENAAGMKDESKGFYYCLKGGDKLEASGRKAEGWAELGCGETVIVGAAVRRFSENFPRGFQMEPGRLSFLMFPEGGFWPRTQKAHDAGMYQFEGGRHKTANMLLWFGEQDRPAPGMLQMLDYPLVARAPFEWYRNTDTVWPLAPAGMSAADNKLREAVARYDRLQLAKIYTEAGDPAGEPVTGWGDDWGKVSIPSLWERAAEVFCGWMNYGDLVWSFGYCSLYYEWPYSMLQQYLRMGNRKFLDVAEDMVRHRCSIDQYHVEKTSPHLGLFQRYERGEHGHLQRQERIRQKWEGNCRASHTWNRGILMHWVMTGSQLSRQTAVENGQAYYNYFYNQEKLGEKEKFPYREFRTPAWAIENWLALYEYTGEKKYLDWANEVFTKTLLAMEKDNGHGHILKDGKQSAQFVGYIIEPVCRLHRLTGRKDVIAFLKRVLDWQRENGTMRGYEKDGKYYPILWIENWHALPDPEKPVSIGAGISYNFLLVDGYAYLYEILGQREDLKFARRLFREVMFYYGLWNGAAPGERTPLGYHFLGSPFGSTPKVHAWSGRFGQLYLAVEEREGGVKLVRQSRPEKIGVEESNEMRR